MKGKVKSVKVIPVSISKDKQANVEALVEASYNIARREMPSPNKFYVYACLKFASLKGGDDFEVRASKFLYSNAKDMLVQLVNRASELLQSDHEVLLKNFQITLFFMAIPAGGSASVSRDKSSILNKTSVNKISNNDSCFRYALVNLIYNKHHQLKQIRMGRKIRNTLSMELCANCNMEWNKPVSFDDLPNVEKILQCKILVLDIGNLPVINATSCIYNSLMYKNSHVKSSTQYWLLHGQEHYHSINNIKGFLAVDYFCPHCLQGFHHKEAFGEHKCTDNEEGVFSNKKRN